tara:strand:- start:370 stop:657 length:288 start_codon:yes stop_codon:yes gene_type:complete
MRLIILFTLFLTACSTAYGQSNTQVNGDLTDECLVSFVQLEEAFIKDETSKGFNPFGSSDDIARMRMLIDMVSMCSQNGLLPGTENLFDVIKKQF